jgi:hypothetical protein
MGRFCTVMSSSLARFDLRAIAAENASLSDTLADAWRELVRLCDAASAPFVPAIEAKHAWDEFAHGLRRALAREAAVLPELIAEAGVRDDRARLRRGHAQLLAALDEAAALLSGSRERFVDVVQDLMTRMVAHDVWQRRCVAPLLDRKLPAHRRVLAVGQLLADAH